MKISKQISRLINRTVYLQAPTSCNSSMLRVFNYIKGKKINDELETPPANIPANIAKWYKSFDSDTGAFLGVEFIDNRDLSTNGNIYSILISLTGGEGCSNICGNPVKICDGTCNNLPGVCIATLTVNITTGITYTVPDGEIDYAMNLLTFKKSNMLIYAGIAVVGLGIIYLATRK